MCRQTLRLFTQTNVLGFNSWKILLCSLQKMYQRCCRLQAKVRNHAEVMNTLATTAAVCVVSTPHLWPWSQCAEAVSLEAACELLAVVQSNVLRLYPWKLLVSSLQWCRIFRATVELSELSHDSTTVELSELSNDSLTVSDRSG